MNTSNRSSHKDDSVANSSISSDVNLSSVIDRSVLQYIDQPHRSNTNLSNLRTDHNYKGFDATLGKSWIYPTNYQIRQYQYNISRVALFKNTLVVLPTGLGKTFIASVVMYNIFRWYPKGKIIFMAPTRPLVAQQIEACYRIMGFPKEETVELTGKQNKKVRAVAWQSKRVFYVTPQVVWSDLNDVDINFPIDDIKLIVVDEAHKAKGKYAYTEVVQSISSRNKMFRVLALSATPGRTVKDVAEVVQNLLISKIEVRRETSIDVSPYVFKKKIKTIVVPLDDNLKRLRSRLHELVGPYVENLQNHSVISGHVGNLSKNWLLHEKKNFVESTISNRHPEHSSIVGNFSVCISMYYAIELLERHGVQVFLNNFNDNSKDGNAEEKFFVMKDPKIREFINEVRAEFGANTFSTEDLSFYGGDVSNIDIDSIDFGHPKFDVLQKCLVEHFEENSDTKAIVFCEYRSTVYLINRLLLSNRPLIKPKVFVGQGSSRLRTITQKEQIEIMNDFRSGKCNTLIATCVAEEGIDVGEVDFIVCFDVNNKNPIRVIQRIGRTGRKRQGKVAMLVTEGKEQQMVKEILTTKDGINHKIAKANEVDSVLYKESPRLIPPEFNPKCVETFIDVKDPEPEPPKESKKKKTKANKKSTKTPIKQPKLRNFFKPIEFDEDMEEHFQLPSGVNTSKGHDDHDEVCQPDEEQINKTTSDIMDVECNEHSANVNTEPEITLKMKLEKIMERYQYIKERHRQNDESKPTAKLNIDKLPPALKEHFFTNNNSIFAQPLKGSRIFEPKIDNNWSKLDRKEQINIFQLMSLMQSVNIDKSDSVWSSDISSLKDTPENNLPIDSQESQPLYFEKVSKYASQLDSQKQLKQEFMNALRQPTITSSTPHKATTTITGALRPPIDSPIGNSPFAKSSKLSFDKNVASSSNPKHHKKSHLQYLGLNSIDDLFVDEDDYEAEIFATNSSTDHSAKSKPAEQKVSTLLEDDEDDCLLLSSQLMLICDQVANENKRKMNESFEQQQTPKRQRLDVGNVDDLFCDDDDGYEDYPSPENVKAKRRSASPADSDCTVDYDVDEVIQKNNISSLKASSDMKLAHNVSKTANKSIPGKAVVQSKSDDLFSTYNETIEHQEKSTRTTASCSNLALTPKRSFAPDYDDCERSPSLLYKSTSVLARSNRGTSTQASSKKSETQLKCDKAEIPFDDFEIDEKSPSPNNLSRHLDILNTQISFSEHFDEFKENLTSPYATCRSNNENKNPNFNAVTNHCDNPGGVEQSNYDEEDDVFATCKSPSQDAKKKKKKTTQRKKSRRRCAFIDDEAGVSGDESSGDDDFIATQMSQFDQTADIDQGDPSVDMHAKYLQSIRTPVRRPFRIPNIGYRNEKAPQNIFSQYVAPDVSTYKEDSFVVDSDEKIEEGEWSSESDSIDEITMKSTGNNRKRKSEECIKNEKKKRRRIIQLSSDSDTD